MTASKRKQNPKPFVSSRFPNSTNPPLTGGGGGGGGAFSRMALIAGSYERFIWGFSLKTLTSSSSSETLALAPLFSYPAHAGPIRCAAAAPRAGLAASGGSDDTVRLYDLPTAADLGPLLDPSAAVSAVAFYSLGPVPRNLLAASDDGLLHLYDADEGFALLASLRVFPRHHEPADALAVHPTGRVALAVGRSGGLAMLNLVRGRRSFSCRLERPATAVAYAEDGAGGDRFVMAAEEKVTVHDSEDARIIHEIDCGKKVLAFAPAKGILYTGGEERGITAWDLSSDGIIRIWDARMIAKEKPTPLAEANTKARLTCLAGSSLNSRSNTPAI
uniref:Uncharacterized protein n=1 Tax=Oryza punctata TaxID=4537 RepID=A0A0E0MPL8_ORYPU